MTMVKVNFQLIVLSCVWVTVHVASFSLVGDLGNRSCLPDV
jgi:hypothetical protein